MPRKNVEFIEKAGLFLMHLFYISPRNVEHLSTKEEDRFLRHSCQLSTKRRYRKQAILARDGS
jgi:hypothetical protein